MDDVAEVEIPQYFLCPISLQIMQDPVTAATGITYDRSNIERWLKAAAAEPVCPVTKQPLPNHHLTPNHTLRRLIQAWCVANACHGVERIPTPKAVLSRAHISKILRGLTLTHLQSTSLDQLLSLTTTTTNDDDKKLMAECGVAKAMVSLIINCYKDRNSVYLKEALQILTAILIPAVLAGEVVRGIVADNVELYDAIAWVLLEDKDVQRRTLAINLIKEVVMVAGSSLVERLKPDFFKGVVGILVDPHHYQHQHHIDDNNNNNSNSNNINVATTKAALRVLLEVCKHGRNRYRIIEANTIFYLLELELGLAQSERNQKLSELVFCLLAQLCSCADGRAQFLAHSGAIAVISKRILRVSAVVDDRAVHIFGLISKFSGTNEVLHEMLKVGAVSKLCMVLQADCAKYLKDKVREMLRMHSHVWNNSPCIQLYLLTRYPMLQY